VDYPLTRQALEDYHRIEAEQPSDSYIVKRRERRLSDRSYTVRAMFASESAPALSRHDGMLLSVEQIERMIREARQDR
jgi:hypothetical protein